MAVLARRPGVAAQVVSVMLGLGVLSVLLAGGDPRQAGLTARYSF